MIVLFILIPLLAALLLIEFKIVKLRHRIPLVLIVFLLALIATARFGVVVGSAIERNSIASSLPILFQHLDDLNEPELSEQISLLRKLASNMEARESNYFISDYLNAPREEKE